MSKNHADRSPLGIYTDNSSALGTRGLQAVDFLTGEILPDPKSPTVARARRWALKSVVNKLLPKSRTSKCMRIPAPIQGGSHSQINLRKNKDNKAFYTGLMACGSVWTCPVCAAKIAERRRSELQKAILKAKSLGWGVYFVTLTVPHGVGDDLQNLLFAQRKAIGRLSSGRASIKTILSSHGVESFGYIRAREITHGKKNGFHPHFHIVYFAEPGHQNVLSDVFKKSWIRACSLAGLPTPSLDHGATVQNGDFAAKYASKWGLEDEMTKANIKITQSKGLTPWGLLQCVLDGGSSGYSSHYASSLFRVYARCMKGQRQLHWSVGLKSKLLESPELTDQEIADLVTDEDSRLIATITFEQWKAIIHFKAESHLLTVAESNERLVLVVAENYRKKFIQRE